MSTSLLRRCISSVYRGSGLHRALRRASGRTCPVTIVALHQVLDALAPRFENLLDVLAGSRRIVDLRTAVAAVRAGQSEPLLAITFDDAYVSLRRNAFPVLRARRLPATVFVPTGICGQFPPWLEGSPWAAHREEMTVMSASELAAEADAGIDFQAHTHSHDDLYRLSAAQLDADFAQNKQVLGQITGRPVWAICYPRGDCDALIRRTAARHFDAGVASWVGISQGPDVYDLHRIDLSDIPDRAEVQRRLAGADEWQNWHLRRRAERRAAELHARELRAGAVRQ